MIKPTVGRIVHYYPARGFPGAAAAGQPLAAIVAKVWNDRCVNLMVSDANGVAYARTSVLLVQEGDAKPGAEFAEWMPYQLGQAAKTEAVEKKMNDTGKIADAMIAQSIKAYAPGQAPRVTLDHINDTVVAENYFTADQGALASYTGVEALSPSLGLLTFCVLTLKNGFTVTGESACASAENFDAEIGRHIARKMAIDKVWMLEGYLLKENLAMEGQNGAKAAFSQDDVARVAHEVNKAYCEALGDLSQPAWEDAPEWQRSSAKMGVTLHTTNPDAGPEASHASWTAQKVADGWTYGAYKDPVNKQHPCIMPFNQLPPEQQAKDFIFRAVVHALVPLD